MSNDHDPINHPKHYTEHPSGVECIQITEHMNFNLGNAFKYVWRADLKEDAIEDLRKAAWYIAREIALRESMKITPSSAMYDVKTTREYFMAHDIRNPPTIKPYSPSVGQWVKITSDGGTLPRVPGIYLVTPWGTPNVPARWSYWCGRDFHGRWTTESEAFDNSAYTPTRIHTWFDLA